MSVFSKHAKDEQIFERPGKKPRTDEERRSAAGDNKKEAIGWGMAGMSCWEATMVSFLSTISLVDVWFGGHFLKP